MFRLPRGRDPTPAMPPVRSKGSATARPSRPGGAV